MSVLPVAGVVIFRGESTSGERDDSRVRKGYIIFKRVILHLYFNGRVIILIISSCIRS